MITDKDRGSRVDNWAVFLAGMAVMFTSMFLMASDSEGGYGIIKRPVNITVSDIAPKLDDTNKLGVSLYGKSAAAGDTALQVGAVNELQTTDVATRPGEDWGSNWRSIKKVASYTWTPALEGPTAVAAASVVVMAAKDMTGYTNFTEVLKNAGGGSGGPLTAATIEVSADNALWIPLTWTTCNTLASGAGCVYSVTGISYRWVRVKATAAANPLDTTVSSWMTANVN